MAKRKKQQAMSDPISIRLPVAVWAFYEGVAAYSGVSIQETISVALAIEMCKRGGLPPKAEGA